MGSDCAGQPGENQTIHLSFPLDVQGDWPPVAAECLPFEAVVGGRRLLVAPLFVGGLSVGDVIECRVDPESDQVKDWQCVANSDHSTYWLLAGPTHEAVVLKGLEKLRSLGCSTVSSGSLGVFSIDVPGAVSIDAVDPILDELEGYGVAVACPSDRHS